MIHFEVDPDPTTNGLGSIPFRKEETLLHRKPSDTNLVKACYYFGSSLLNKSSKRTNANWTRKVIHLFVLWIESGVLHLFYKLHDRF